MGLVNQEDTARSTITCSSGSRAFNAEAMENIAFPLLPPALPLPPWEWGMRWVSLAIFFLALGLGDVLHCWNLPSEGTVVGVFVRLVSPAEGGWCAGTSPFSIHCMHACVSTETRSLSHGPHHHHHHPLTTHHTPHTTVAVSVQEQFRFELALQQSACVSRASVCVL